MTLTLPAESRPLFTRSKQLEIGGVAGFTVMVAASMTIQISDPVQIAASALLVLTAAPRQVILRLGLRRAYASRRSPNVLSAQTIAAERDVRTDSIWRIFRVLSGLVFAACIATVAQAAMSPLVVALLAFVYSTLVAIGNDAFEAAVRFEPATPET